MQSIGFVVPLLPGKAEADRAALASCWHGDRQAAYEDARRRAGVTRESVWLQSTPSGEVAVVVMEADDIGAALGVIGGSGEPFDVWFREHVMEVHGIDLSAGFPPPEPVLDFRVEA
ncbi:MAG: hypothetical protein Q8K58_15890 [Acidimicrobiales bacterium]|nr:hypothetical protein [Acidimicrobiales bacterium]